MHKNLAKKIKWNLIFSLISGCLIIGIVLFITVIKTYFPRPKFDPDGTFVTIFILVPLIILSTVLALIAIIRTKKQVQFLNSKKHSIPIYVMSTPILIFWVIFFCYLIKFLLTRS